MDKEGFEPEEDKVIYGLFWQITKKSISIHHSGLIDFIASEGFFWAKIENHPVLMKRVNNIIEESNITEIVNCVSNHIEEKVPEELGHGYQVKDLRNVFARGISNYINVNKLRLLPLVKVKSHRDSKNKCYFYFKNCVVEVSAASLRLLTYGELDGCVWAKQVSPYNFTLLPADAQAGQYETFCFRASNKDKARYRSLQSILGYMLHRYYSPSKAMIPVILDETITSAGDEANGASGKSQICIGLSFVRNVVTIDGKTFNPNSSFPYQRVDRDTDIILIDDLARHISFESFFSVLTTGLEINKKGIAEFKLSVEQALKFIITSNYPVKSVAGISTERRKVEFETGTYYNENRSIRDDFGCEFYTVDWSEAEYNTMFNFFIECAQLYLSGGVIKPPSINTELRKLISAITIDLKDFLDNQVEQRVKKFNKRELYADYIKLNPGQRDYNRSQNKFIGRVHKYLDFMGIKYIETPANTKTTINLTYADYSIKEEVAVVAKKTDNGNSNVKNKYVLVDTPEKRAQLLSTLLSSQRFAFDTETAPGDYGDALTIHSLDLVCVSFSVKAGEAFCLPLPKDKKEAAKILQEFAPAFGNEQIIKVGHNIKFDMLLRKYGIVVKGQLFDTMVAHYLCDPEAPHGLKELSLALLGIDQTKIEELIGKGKNQLSMRDVPMRKVTDYACQDADVTLQLMQKLEPMLKEKDAEKLFYDMESRLVYVLADMEYTGVCINYEILGSLYDKVFPIHNNLGERIYQMAGKEFNINSAPQLAEYLYDDLGLPIKERTKKGAPSVGKHTLAKIKDEHPSIPLILEYKQLSTVISTYLLGLPDNINPETNKVHTKLNQCIARTGRLSSSEPNLQNIPMRTEIGAEIRKAFIASNSNHKIISADYSQVEIRLMAEFSKDPSLIEAFNNGVDVHLAMASKVFGLPIDQITKEQRATVKGITFGLNYGMSDKGLADYLSESTGKKVSVSEAEEYKQAYFTQFEAVQAFHEKACELASERGYSETLFGRRRHIPDINEANIGKRNAAKRIAINSPVQGSASDIIKIAMVRIFDRLNSGGYKTKGILQVHDELIFDAPVNEIDAVKAIIKECMEGAATLSVPLVVDIGVGDNWYEAH